MIADHEKDYWHCHEGIVLGTQLRLSAERRIKLAARTTAAHHLALSRKNHKPNIGRHNGPEHRAHVDKSSAPTENMHHSPGDRGSHHQRKCRERPFRIAEI